MATPKTPPHLKAGGKRLWRTVTDDYELGEHEQVILLEACRTVDSLQALEDVVNAEGVTHLSPQGVRAHPALVEARQQRVTLAKLVAALRIPLDEDELAGRTQRRVGIRRPGLGIAQ